jgi:hypothetical protein
VRNKSAACDSKVCCHTSLLRILASPRGGLEVGSNENIHCLVLVGRFEGDSIELDE